MGNRNEGSKGAPARLRFDELRSELVDRLGIVRSKPIVTRVRVRELVGDEKGLTVQMDVIPSGGLVSPREGSMKFWARWEGCSITRRCIAGGAYSGWQVYLDDTLTQEVCDVGETLGETIFVPGDGDFETLMARYLRLSKIVGKHEMSCLERGEVD